MLEAGEACPRRFEIVTTSMPASISITLKIYAHLFGKNDGKAAEAINAALSGENKR